MRTHRWQMFLFVLKDWFSSLAMRFWLPFASAAVFRVLLEDIGCLPFTKELRKFRLRISIWVERFPFSPKSGISAETYSARLWKPRALKMWLIVNVPTGKEELPFQQNLNFSRKPKAKYSTEDWAIQKDNSTSGTSTQAIFPARHAQATYTWVLILIYRQTRFFTEGRTETAKRSFSYSGCVTFFIYCHLNFTFC